MTIIKPKIKVWFILTILLFVISSPSLSSNQTLQSFSKAKKLLETIVYQDHRKTLYCGASFNANKQVTPLAGFITTKYVKRSKKIEWEHVVPAENFGRTFSEWRDGHETCVSSKGKLYKGRKCAEKANMAYRHMQADLYNLYPAIGAVNALRSNYNFTMLPNTQSNFGNCSMKIINRKAEPPFNARGRIARTYLYMEETYKRYSMSKQQRKLMQAWNRFHPVTEWECERVKRITQIQQSENIIVKKQCINKSLWY
jgi:deoxyribonuclease-1